MFEEYININSDKQFETLFEELSKPVFRTEDFEIRPRALSHWESKGLFLTKRETSKSSRLVNFTEYCWIKLIGELRELGYPIKMIHEIKPQLTEPLSCDQILEISGYSQEGAESLKNKTAHSPISILTLALITYIGQRNDIGIRFYNNSSIAFYDPDKKEEYLKDNTWNELNRPHVSIQLAHLLAKYISIKDKTRTPSNIEVLTDKEADVLQHIRQENIKSLNIKFNEKNEISLIESMESIQGVKLETRFLDTILRNGYQEIKFRTKAGKIVSFTRTTQYKT